MSASNPGTASAEDGWRRLSPPVDVLVYLAQGWHDAVAVGVNDETREIRVEWPPRDRDLALDLVTHRVLDAALYTDPTGSLQAPRTPR